MTLLNVDDILILMEIRVSDDMLFENIVGFN